MPCLPKQSHLALHLSPDGVQPGPVGTGPAVPDVQKVGCSQPDKSILELIIFKVEVQKQDPFRSQGDVKV